MEAQLREANEIQPDVIPFHDQAFLIWRKIHQVQLKLVEEIYKIKKEETRLKEILAISIDFGTRLLEVVEKVQGQLNWVEANSAFPEHLPQKKTED